MRLFRERLLSRLVDKHAISQELAERTYRVGIKEILDHFGLSPPEHPKPPPALHEVQRVPIVEEGREIEGPCRRRAPAARMARQQEAPGTTMPARRVVLGPVAVAGCVLITIVAVRRANRAPDPDRRGSRGLAARRRAEVAT